MQTLTVPQGEFRLARYPLRAREPARARAAAAEYLLHYLKRRTAAHCGCGATKRIAALCLLLAMWRIRTKELR